MMVCPGCGSFYEEGDHFCSVCGIPLTESESPVPRRKHTVWPPVLIMLAMVIVGFVVYFATESRQDPPAAAEYPWFQMDGGVLYFIEDAYTGGSQLVIPETVDGQSVTVLGADCFADCDDLVSVILPDSLAEIQDGAFRNCDALRGIFIPSGVMFLGESAFENCQALEAVYFEAIPTAIGSNAFDSCQSIRYIFFNGYSDQWASLYSEFINPYAYIACQDGIYPQGGQMP